MSIETTLQALEASTEDRVYLDNVRRERELMQAQAMTNEQWDRLHLIAVGFAVNRPYPMPNKETST